MHRTLPILLLLLWSIGTPHMQGAETRHIVECGQTIQLRAIAAPDFHFVRWSDGSTDSIRHIEVRSDATYLAYFAANCADYANWPVVTLYDWLLMLNVTAINELGYHFAPENVTWYRVQGDVDALTDTRRDDILVGTGYYLTLEKNLRGTGDYYAVVDVSATASGMLCTDLMRSVIVHYSGEEEHARHISLQPNVTFPAQTVRLVGLDPMESTDILIYDAMGRLITTYRISGETYYSMPAPSAQGYFLVRALSPTCQSTLPLLVQ